MPTDFTQRLRDNLAAREATYARVEARILAAREAGVDTSRTSAASPCSGDHALSRAEGDVTAARRDLDRYLAARAARANATN